MNYFCQCIAFSMIALSVIACSDSNRNIIEDETLKILRESSGNNEYAVFITDRNCGNCMNYLFNYLHSNEIKNTIIQVSKSKTIDQAQNFRFATATKIELLEDELKNQIAEIPSPIVLNVKNIQNSNGIIVNTDPTKFKDKLDKLFKIR